MLGMLLDDVGPIPVVSAGSASTSQGPGCSPNTWQISVTWAVSVANDRHWQIDVYTSVNGGAFNLNVSALSTTSTGFTDDTGVTSDGTIVSTDSRAYQIKVVARGQAASVANTTSSGTVNQSLGNPC